MFPRRTGPPSSGRARRDRGVAAVGVTLIVALGAGLLGVLADAGLYAVADVTAGGIADDAARVAIVDRAAADVDARVLAEVRDRAAGLRRVQVDRVVVYRATGPDAGPPSACTTGSADAAPADLCSVYEGEDLLRPPQDLTCRWCPADRCLRDLVGVWITMSYRPLTALAPTLTFTEHAVNDLGRGPALPPTIPPTSTGGPRT